MTPTPNNKISVVSLDKRFKKQEAEIKKDILRVLEILNSGAQRDRSPDRKRRGKDKISIDIYLAGNAVMKKLNVKFKNKNYPADILSFEEPSDFIMPESEQKKVGEIFLNVSKKSGIKKLLVHGVLHLFGYTHKKERDGEKMERMEDKIINDLTF